jgi:hypothetical protein
MPHRQLERIDSGRISLLDLPAHSQPKEGQEVDQQNRPVYRNIGSPSNGTQQCDSISFGCGIPKLEFYSSALRQDMPT